jgi:hypothetical protein
VTVGWTIWGSIPGRSKKFFSFCGELGCTQHLFDEYGDYLVVFKAAGEQNWLPLVLRLGRGAAVPFPPLYAFLAYTGTYFLLLYFLNQEEKQVCNKISPISCRCNCVVAKLFTLHRKYIYLYFHEVFTTSVLDGRLWVRYILDSIILGFPLGSTFLVLSLLLWKMIFRNKFSNWPNKGVCS